MKNFALSHSLSALLLIPHVLIANNLSLFCHTPSSPFFHTAGISDTMVTK